MKRVLIAFVFFTIIPWYDSIASEVEPFAIMGKTIQPGTHQRIELVIGENFTGDELPIPVFVTHGRKKGSTVCLTAGIHGDEVNGIEIVRRLISETNGKPISGTIVGIPIVNLPAFLRGRRYLPDRRDLNRYFPGRKTGSSASRIAYQVFEQVIKNCDYLIDFHTGSLRRTNLPQVRGNAQNPKVQFLMQAFGGKVALDKGGGRGTLRRAAVDAGIPAIIYEAGAPTRFEESKIREGLAGTYRVLSALGTLKSDEKSKYDTRQFKHTYWVRAERGGIMLTKVKLGQEVRTGDVLARIFDPFKEVAAEVKAERPGMVIGMAYNQVVMPGFALFHIGTTVPSRDKESETPLEPTPDDEQPAEDGPPE